MATAKARETEREARIAAWLDVYGPRSGLPRGVTNYGNLKKEIAEQDRQDRDDVVKRLTKLVRKIKKDGLAPHATELARISHGVGELTAIPAETYDPLLDLVAGLVGELGIAPQTASRRVAERYLMDDLRATDGLDARLPQNRAAKIVEKAKERKRRWEALLTRYQRRADERIVPRRPSDRSRPPGSHHR